MVKDSSVFESLKFSVFDTIKNILANYVYHNRKKHSINVTGEKNGNNIFPRPGIEPGPSAWPANTLPRRYKSRLVPQGSTSV